MLLGLQVSPESAQLQCSEKSKGMVLPFRPLNLAFSHMYYSVDLPPVSKSTLPMVCLLCSLYMYETASCQLWACPGIRIASCR